jgi:hypothetical protein
LQNFPLGGAVSVKLLSVKTEGAQKNFKKFLKYGPFWVAILYFPVLLVLDAGASEGNTRKIVK